MGVVQKAGKFTLLKKNRNEAKAILAKYESVNPRNFTLEQIFALHCFRCVTTIDPETDAPGDITHLEFVDIEQRGNYPDFHFFGLINHLVEANSFLEFEDHRDHEIFRFVFGEPKLRRQTQTLTWVDNEQHD